MPVGKREISRKWRPLSRWDINVVYLAVCRPWLFTASVVFLQCGLLFFPKISLRQELGLSVRLCLCLPICLWSRACTSDWWNERISPRCQATRRMRAQPHSQRPSVRPGPKTKPVFCVVNSSTSGVAELFYVYVRVCAAIVYSHYHRPIYLIRFLPPVNFSYLSCTLGVVRQF